MQQRQEAPSESEAVRGAWIESILLPGADVEGAYAAPASAACLRDLGLDGIVEAAASSPDSRAVFLAPLKDGDAIRYRQEILRDLEDGDLRAAAASFRADMHAARLRLDGAHDAGFPYARERASLDAAVRYVRAVSGLARALERAHSAARGLERLRDALSRTVGADAFRTLADDSRSVSGRLSRLRYTLLLEGRSVTVGPDRASVELPDEIERLFGRFMQSSAPAPEVRSYLPAGPNGVQARILRRLAGLHPEAFEQLSAFASRHRDVIDPAMERLGRELGFYLDVHAAIAPLREAGLPFCYPAVGRREDGCRCRGAFDLALAQRLLGSDRSVVPNDIELRGSERMMVVTGPNQGGKTTYARTFGQVHYLAALGCPVPGREARLAPFDRILTHFERGDRPQDQRGRLVDELTRLRTLLEVATPDSVVVLNETFSSTALADARFLGEKLLGKLSRLDLRAVFVTFVDALASYDAKTVSVVCAVPPEDPSRRTFELVRGPADGAAHALAIARRHGVTFEQMVERLKA